MANDINELLKSSSEKRKELLDKTEEAIQRFETKKVIQTVEKIFDSF